MSLAGCAPERTETQLIGKRTMVLFDAYPFAVGGAHRVLVRLVACFEAAGWSVSVVLPADGPTSSWLSEQGVRVVIVQAPATLLGFGGSTSAAAALALPRYWRRLRTELKDVDLLWVGDLRGMLLAGMAGRGARARVVWHVHARPPQLARLHRWVGHLAHSVVVPSCALAAELGLSARAVVLPNAVEPGPPRSGDPTRPTVLTVARLDGTKGIDVLVRAAARLREAGQPVHVIVAGGEQPGRSGERAALEALVDDLALGDLVELRGEVAEVSVLYDEASVYVQPSRHESFGLAALEAMAAGLPVVVSDAGGLPELVGQDGLVFAAGDAQGLAAALKALLDDGDLRQRLGANGRARAISTFSPAAFSRTAVTLADDLVPTRGGQS